VNYTDNFGIGTLASDRASVHSESLTLFTAPSTEQSYMNYSSRLAIASIAALATLIPTGLATAQSLRSNPTPSNSTPSRSTPTETNAPVSRNGNPRFACETSGNEPTVVYRPQSRSGQSYPWAKPGTLGGGWSADRRCVEIARRLEEYRPDGLLEMQNSTENGYNTLCVTTEANSRCRIVLTVPEGQDPRVTRDRVFSNLSVADAGQQTSAVNTYSGDGAEMLNQLGQAVGVDLSGLGRGQSRGQSRSSSDVINLRPFLDGADGGTGAQL
jgi:Circadian oscillating protein COP23